jgi:hypothetical protein
MNNYTITIIGNGDEGEAVAIALACSASLAGAGHKVIQAIVNVDRGGQHDLLSTEDKQAALEAVAVEAVVKEG